MQTQETRELDQLRFRADIMHTHYQWLDQWSTLSSLMLVVATDLAFAAATVDLMPAVNLEVPWLWSPLTHC